MTSTTDELRRIFHQGTLIGLDDARLLQRFALDGDDRAFAALVGRHGPLVWSTCRAALGDPHAADDAFQATFLILARQARSLAVEDSLAGWLRRVARRVARQARIESARRRRREAVAAARTGREVEAHDVARRETQALIRQELAKLPERERLPIVLCDLDGLTRDEAAEALGWPSGTVAGRLARGRERLRDRLRRRGLAPLAMLAPERPVRLAAVVAKAVSLANGGPVSPEVARLAASSVRGLVPASLAAGLAFVLAIVPVGMTPRDGEVTEPPGPPATIAVVAPSPRPQQPIDPDDPATAGLFAGRVVDLEGRPVAGAKLHVMPRNRPEGERGPGPVRAVSDADGRFRFEAQDMTFASLDGLAARRPGLLIATAEGFGPGWVFTWGETGSSFRSHTDPIKAAEETLTLAPDDVPIRGRLLDPEGRPLAGATVALRGLMVPWDRDLDAHLEKTRRPVGLFSSRDYDRSIYAPAILALPGVTTAAVADTDGRFTLRGLGRERLVNLAVSGPGVVDTTFEVMTRDDPDFLAGPAANPHEAVTHGASFIRQLKPGRSLHAFVRDKATGEPLPGVRVGPWSPPLDGSGPAASGTDPRGYFVVNGLDAGSRPESLTFWAVPSPGQPYLAARGTANAAADRVTIDCPRGVPFHLTVVDGEGRPVKAEVKYAAIGPNPHAVDGVASQAIAERRPDGSYRGVALPGPGAVLVRTPRSAGYRPACVDPKGFFAPGRNDWSPQERISAYGTLDTLILATGNWDDQHDYAAIVLIDPAEGADRLDLRATVEPDRPRLCHLVDPEGRPIVGVQSTGLTYHPWDAEPKLRAADFPITRLHPDRSRWITFVHEERKLIGSLLARGDGDAPYTVTLQPWATVTGRFLDPGGRPYDADAPATKGIVRGPERPRIGNPPDREFLVRDDPAAGLIGSPETEPSGRFRIERLVPGLSYTGQIYLGTGVIGGLAFEDLTPLPGEVRDLGDIRPAPPVTLDPNRPIVTPP